MRLAMVNLIATITLALSGQAFAVEKKPCSPGEQEVMAKDRTTMCVKAYGARPELKGSASYHGAPSASASATPAR